MIPRQLGMQGNAAVYSNANVWMQTFDCCCIITNKQTLYDISLMAAMYDDYNPKLPPA